MSNLINNRQIRLFISSTFQDMQGERDYLIKYTFPRLRHLASRRDVTLTELDLRWGITEEESRTGKVVEICLKEIENSIPFFIGIIGNRYGWQPSERDICDSEEMKGRFRWVYDDIKDGLSVTEMEMQYGVLRRSSTMNASFYIKRSGENSSECDSPEMLETLKKNVRNNGRYPVYEYSTFEELAERVENEFIEMLKRIFPESDDSGCNREASLQHCIVRQLCDVYVGNEEERKKIDDFVFNSPKAYLTVSGPSGIGKSAFLANWIEENSDQSRFNILYFFTQGASETSNEYVLEYFKETLIRMCPRLSDEKDRDTTLAEIIQKSGKPVLIILDGIEVFQNVDNWQVNSMGWLPVIPDGSKIILSSSNGERTFSPFDMKTRGSEEESITISGLEYAQRTDIIKSCLSNFGKKLDITQEKKIADFGLSSNPRILTTLLNDLICNSTHETLVSSIDGFILATNTDEFYQEYIRHLESNYGQELIRGILLLATIPVFGLTERDFIEIQQVKQLEWSTVFCSLSSSFGVYGGYIKFSDRKFEKAVLDYYKVRVPEYRDRIISFLENKVKTEDCERTRNRIWEELCEQYYIKQDPEALYGLISDFNVFWFLTFKRASARVSIGGAKQIYRYWEWLYSLDPEKYNLATYLPVAEKNPELFIKNSSEITDSAAHSYDNLSILRIVLKLMDIMRGGASVSGKDVEYIAGEIGLASLAAKDFGLTGISQKLDGVKTDFQSAGIFSKRIDRWEQALRHFVQARISKGQNERIAALESAISKVGGLKIYARDLYNMRYELSCIEIDAGKLEQADTSLEMLLREIKDIRPRKYDDSWECFKAEIMGKLVVVKKELGHYEKALEMCEKTIIQWEDIEDWRIESGSSWATIDNVLYYSEMYDEIVVLLNNKS